MNFKEFLEEQSQNSVLDEAIRPKETHFGSNFPDVDNAQWKSVTYLGFSLTSTAFDGDDRWVVVDIAPGNHIIFRTYPKTSSILTFDDLVSNARYDSRKMFRGNANAISIIKKVLYVGLTRLKHESSFTFSSEDPSLVKLYRAIINSRAFKEEMSKLNFEPVEIDDGISHIKVTFNKR
jgi:hypothetical protein